MSKNVRRLFTEFQPTSYTLHINPDRDRMRLSGTVTIVGKKAGRPSQRLTFHQSGLKITKATIARHDKKAKRDILPTRINHHNKFEEVRLHASELLYPGMYEVTMEFEGAITRHMEGVYPCFFKQDGQDKQLIATQFESHFARQAFPCIDEPEAKATFDLSLTSPKGETVLANTPIKKQVEQDGKLLTVFETTPKMPTYLLAFVYGDLGYKEATTKSGTVIRAYATPDNVKHTDFAVDLAVKCLEYFEDYFAIHFPLPKCDLVALPDFASGAMENWGLITFREAGLFVDPDNTSLNSKQYVAEVICHELTHQWFGNLVTMRWWTDLWLNEGFANVMAFYAVDHLFPKWQFMTQYVVDEQQPGMKLDALANTHPIEVPVHHPDEIRTIFDAISYNKGGSSIMMLREYLGEESFRDGLRHYLAKHAYGNTNTVDLWDSLETVSKKPVRAIMHAWTSQPGFPLVRAVVDGTKVHVAQEPFLVNPKERAKHQHKYLWPIALEGGTGVPEVLDTAELDFEIAKPEQFKLNLGQLGFYRTIYNPEHVQVLANRVADNKLAPLDRMGVLSDAFEAAKSGYGDTVSALTLMEAYRNEDNTAVWEVMAGNIGAIRTIMDDNALREAIKPYNRKLIATQLRRLGWQAKPRESHFDTLLRPIILGIASNADEPSVIKEALHRFNTMQRPEDLPPDLRGVIYLTAARHGNAKTFDRLLELYQSASPEDQVTLAAALTDFEQPELIKRALALITTDTVRLQDITYWVIYSFSNRFARQLAWEWLVKNWAWLREHIGNDLGFARMPIYAARTASENTFLPKYKKFFESVMEPSLERSYKQGVEMIEWQSAWRDRDLTAIKKFFKA